MNTPFPVDPELTAITIAYRNLGYIADLVLPRVPVSLQQFKYWQYPVAESFIIPDTKVGRRGQPNEVDLTATEATSSTNDYGLDDPIPQSDIDQAPQGKNPQDRATSQLTDYIMLDRETRAAGLVFDATQYGAGYKIQLSGTDQWSDFANSDPIDDILLALDTPLMRPNICVMGNAVWTKLRAHPKIVQAIYGQAVAGGIVSREAFASLFELEELIIGQSRLNTAKKGQTASLSRVWGKHCLFAYRNRSASTSGGLTFGFTAEYGSRIAGSMPDAKIGLRGGQRVRVGESVKELIVAPMAAYFIEDATA